MPVLKVKKNGVWEEVGATNLELDTTLTQSGAAADAKAVGDVIARFAPVATSGNYNDLVNKPEIPSVEDLATVPNIVTEDWVFTLEDGSTVTKKMAVIGE